MITNERKAELLDCLRKLISLSNIALYECTSKEEQEFVHFEKNRLLADLDYSIKYYEEHKYDTK